MIDEDPPEIDPKKVDILFENSFLNREATIRIRALDDETFKSLLKWLDLFEEEMRDNLLP